MGRQKRKERRIRAHVVRGYREGSRREGASWEGDAARCQKVQHSSPRGKKGGRKTFCIITRQPKEEKGNKTRRGEQPRKGNKYLRIDVTEMKATNAGRWQVDFEKGKGGQSRRGGRGVVKRGKLGRGGSCTGGDVGDESYKAGKNGKRRALFRGAGERGGSACLNGGKGGGKHRKTQQGLRDQMDDDCGKRWSEKKSPA